MMNKLIIIALLMLSNVCFGQYDKETFSDTTQKESKVNPRVLKEHIYVGGDFSMSFGNLLYLYMAPVVGYEIYKGISAGVSPMYQLYRINQNNGGSVSFHSYGMGVFGRYRPEPFPPLLLQTEFAVYNTDDFSTLDPTDRINAPAFFGGIGYAGSLGERSYYQVMLKYDFINNPNNPLPKLFFNLPLYLSYGMVFYLG